MVFLIVRSISSLKFVTPVQWKTRSAKCGKCGVWKMLGVENAECGKCRKFQFQYEINKHIYILMKRVFYNIVTLAC